ncbi:MAG TPA: hypothetical protein VMV69_07480 [Pirellulales bacterium]|nr:hypothetical protein [Pirellulales bacterium]
MASKKKPIPTFVVRLAAPGLAPEQIPLRAVSDSLSAVQDLASGRDSFETSHVPPEKGIGLTEVRSGSAVYYCVSRAPDEAKVNLTRIGALLSASDDHELAEDGLVAALRPIQLLSDVARGVKCRVEVALFDEQRSPLFAIGEDAFDKISSRLLLKGDTSVVGTVERVGGATRMRCLLRVPGRRKLLYCDLETKELVRRLGQHLYEQIAASGTAVWIHRSWRIYQFTIRDFNQPKLGNPDDSLRELRNAGLNAWDQVSDPEGFMREIRS